MTKKNGFAGVMSAYFGAAFWNEVRRTAATDRRDPLRELDPAARGVLEGAALASIGGGDAAAVKALVGDLTHEKHDASGDAKVRNLTRAMPCGGLVPSQSEAVRKGLLLDGAQMAPREWRDEVGRLMRLFGVARAELSGH